MTAITISKLITICVFQACQFDAANVVYYNIGDSAQATWSFDGLNVTVQYTSDDGVR